MDTNERFADRLRFAISNAGSIQKLGERARVAPRTISGYLVGKGDPSRQRLIALADAGEVSVEWLATGRGDPSSHQEGHTAVLNANDVSLSGFTVVPHFDADGSSRGLEHSTHTEAASIAVRVELLHAIGLNETDVKMVTARGDSMAPTINEGDRLVIDTTVNAIRDDAIYVLRIGAELMLRRVQRDVRGGGWVITDASHYENEHLAESGFNSLKVVGRPILRVTQTT